MYTTELQKTAKIENLEDPELLVGKAEQMAEGLGGKAGHSEIHLGSPAALEPSCPVARAPALRRLLSNRKACETAPPPHVDWCVD